MHESRLVVVQNLGGLANHHTGDVIRWNEGPSPLLNACPDFACVFIKQQTVLNQAAQQHVDAR